MSARILLLVALIWFGAVVIWSLFGFSFFVGLGHGRGAKVAAVTLAYLILIFTFGWIVPLVLGAYRLVKKH